VFLFLNDSFITLLRQASMVDTLVQVSDKAGHQSKLPIRINDIIGTIFATSICWVQGLCLGSNGGGLGLAATPPPPGLEKAMG
jgi:hypothetical protein